MASYSIRATNLDLGKFVLSNEANNNQEHQVYTGI